MPRRPSPVQETTSPGGGTTTTTTTTTTLTSTRSRTVPGSCWPCKKRRVKCDLGKPICQRCLSLGAPCDYNTRLIRWSKPASSASPPPSTTTPSPKIRSLSPFSGSDRRLGSRERLALDYFHSRVWPLLSTAEEPCPPPIPVALEHRAVLLTTCLLAESHRFLQDGAGDLDHLNDQRMECLAAVRSDVDECCTSVAEQGGGRSLLTLLFAVLFLYIDDGFMECMRRHASTWSHHAGVLAVLKSMGGMEKMLTTGPEALQMLLSEFASADLTTAVLQTKRPAVSPPTWDVIDRGAVWWGLDGMRRYSLASTFKLLSEIAFYIDDIARGTDSLSMGRIREFEIALRPMNAPISVRDLHLAGALDEKAAADTSEPDGDSLQLLTLLRAFQHGALIYLYRALCGLSATHPLVQQHVQSCLEAVLEIPPEAHALNCVIFPLCIAGAHAGGEKQREVVLHMVNKIHENMKFAAVQLVRMLFHELWTSADAHTLTWRDMFAKLGPHVLIL
ncbi:hypothetical protein NLU13_5532 [Sarocladium strictum]|uniref:Zn(2)-C6 fungal-type domain-containing protein n=1 Tax=Sarocladium strictum TaxID=5046 RepID=A0AA39GIQ2_SARSR|nr:hypothetical protein NLU13_5532 [Sarocladium strictum]